MSRLDILQSYISASVQILDDLSRRGVVAIDDAVPRTTLLTSVLDLPQQRDFDSALRLELLSRSLGNTLVDEICRLYQKHSLSWRENLQTKWTALHVRLRGLDARAASLDLLRDAYRSNFSRRLHDMQSEILGVLDKRINDFLLDSEVAASASSTDQSTDTDEDNARGHRAEAVAILEAAYTYTTNITQAEKRRLAQATGLEPRQVVIWFQNRRNRKVKGRSEVATPVIDTNRTSPSADSSRKRKMSCNVGAGPRRPTTLATPEKKACLRDTPPSTVDQRLLSSSSNASLGSSVDSRTDSLLGDCPGFRMVRKKRTVSSESAATSYTSTSTCSSFASTPASEHCSRARGQNAQQSSQPAYYGHERPISESVDAAHTFAQDLLVAPTPYVHRSAPPIEIAHIFNEGQTYPSSLWDSGPASSALVFSEDSDVPRLDFDDLGLDVADFGKDIALPFDFSAPPPAGGAQLWQRGTAGSEAPAGLVHGQNPFAVTFASASQNNIAAETPSHSRAATRPHQFADVAGALNDGDFDLFAALASLPTFQGMPPEAIVEFAASGGQDLSSKAEQTWNAQSSLRPGCASTSSFTPRERDVVTPPSRTNDATSPEDFGFTFDFAGLGLERTFEEVRQSYRVADEEAKMYSISDVEDEVFAGSMSGWETGPEEAQDHQANRLSSITMRPASPTSPIASSSPWTIPARPVDLHAQRGTRQAGGSVSAS